jgi:hypothetical protein
MTEPAFKPDVTQIAGRDPATLPNDAILAISVGRDEEPQIPWFLEYYRGLGVDHFLYIDNDSGDNSRDLLAAEEDVTLFHTDQGYMESARGRHWSMHVARQFATGHWTLTIDLDELLIYPMVEQMGLRGLTEWMDAQDAEALLTIMLDMYPKAPAPYAPGTSFVDASPFFDQGPYWVNYTQTFPHVSFFGGPRHRLLFDGDTEKGPISRAGAPVLRKVPLVKWRKDTEYLASTHQVTPHNLSDVTGALLHFKFLKDFHAYAEREVARGERNPGEYEDYLKLSPDAFWAQLHGEQTVQYTGSVQLMELGLIHGSKEALADLYQRVRKTLPRDTAAALWQDIKASRLSQNRAFQMQIGHYFADIDAKR